MTRAAIRLVFCGALVCLTAAVTMAQTSTTSETKKFQVIAVDGNQLVVRVPEGTRELTVPADFRFNVDGKMLSAQELKPGMAGTATVTTRTTLVPVSVTEVKNGTVMQAQGNSIIVRTDDGIKMFTQSDIDKRGVKIMRDGQPATISDFRANDRLTATIVTTKPPRTITEKEVQATLAKSGGAPAATPASSTAQAPASSTCTVSGRADVGCCAEDVAQDGEPAAVSCAHRLCLAPSGVGSCRQASSRSALAEQFVNRRRVTVAVAAGARAMFQLEACLLRARERGTPRG